MVLPGESVTTRLALFGPDDTGEKMTVTPQPAMGSRGPSQAGSPLAVNSAAFIPTTVGITWRGPLTVKREEDFIPTGTIPKSWMVGDTTNLPSMPWPKSMARATTPPEPTPRTAVLPPRLSGLKRTLTVQLASGRRIHAEH